MLEKEYKYFNDNQDDIIKKYLNKFIVIKGEQIIGSYDTEEDALKDTLKNNKLGTFLLQFVSASKDNYHQKFYSRVMFANPNPS